MHSVSISNVWQMHEDEPNEAIGDRDVWDREMCELWCIALFNAISVSCSAFVLQLNKSPFCPPPFPVSFPAKNLILEGWLGKARVEKQETFVFTHTALPGNFQKC